QGSLSAVTFSSDASTCATAGEDRQICLWDVATGHLRYHLPAGHLGAVTSLEWKLPDQIVSAARDNTLRVWKVGSSSGSLLATFTNRSGEVSRLGLSPDGMHTLFDQDQALRLLALPEGKVDGILQNGSDALHFA